MYNAPVDVKYIVSTVVTIFVISGCGAYDQPDKTKSDHTLIGYTVAADSEFALPIEGEPIEWRTETQGRVIFDKDAETLVYLPEKGFIGKERVWVEYITLDDTVHTKTVTIEVVK